MPDQFSILLGNESKWMDRTTGDYFVSLHGGYSHFSASCVRKKQKQFLSLTHHSTIFAQTLTQKLLKEVPYLCKFIHMYRLLFLFYNCLAMNFVNNLNSNIISKTSGVMKKLQNCNLLDNAQEFFDQISYFSFLEKMLPN